MPAPDSMFVEVEFDSGVWTDITSYVDFSAGVSVKFGRTGPFSDPQPGTLDLTLDNTDGRFTPLRQTLIDGTAHPYWPNLVPRRRIRMGDVVSSVRYTRFTGYVRGWPPGVKDAYRPRVAISATTQDDRLSRVILGPPIAQEAQWIGPPVYYWPLTDPQGSTSAYEVGGGQALQIRGSTPLLAFGGNGPGVGDGTGVTFAATNATNGQRLETASLLTLAAPTSAFSVQLWVNIGAAAPGWTMTVVESAGGASASAGNAVTIDTSGRPVLTAGPLGGTVTATSIADNGWHLIGVDERYDPDVTQWRSQFYVDGVFIGQVLSTSATGNTTLSNLGNVIVGRGYAGGIGQVLVFPSTAKVGSAATNGFDGETVSARVIRFLSYAGLLGSGTDMNVDTSTVVCGTYDQDGKDVLNAVKDLAVTEGGGSVGYTGPDGFFRFTNRAFRKPGSPSLTLDALADLDGLNFDPAYDDTQVVNRVEGTRSTATSSPSVQIVNDAAGEDLYGLLVDSFTSYAKSDSDVLFNAQDRLARQHVPDYRLGQVSVDLFTATTAGLYAGTAGIEIGDRLRITNIYSANAPATQVDVIVEGWALDTDGTNYVFTFDTSPADNPPLGVYDTSRWQADQLFLGSAITNSATSLAITSGRTNLITNPSFESATTGWTGTVLGYTTPTIARSTTRAYPADGYGALASLLVTWPTTADGKTAVAYVASGLTIGAQYTFSVYVYVPTGNPAVQALEMFSSRGSTSTLFNQWQRISLRKTATATQHAFGISIPVGGSTTSGQTCNIDAAMLELSSTVNPYIEGTTSPSTPMFTTTAGAYPMNIQLGTEIITLNSAPAGSTSPQSFTGVTRGAAGTAAAAQVVGTTVLLAPASTWTL